MSNIKNLSDLLDALQEPDSCIVKDTVFSLCKFYPFPIILRNIAEDVTTCRCNANGNPFCRISLLSTLLRFCSDDYSLLPDPKEFNAEKVEAGQEEGEQYFNDLLRIASHADVKEFVDREFYNYSQEDFPETAIRATAVFQFFTLFFQRLSPADFPSPKHFLDITARLISKAGAHANLDNSPWAHRSSVEGAGRLLLSLSRCCSCESISELLTWSALSEIEHFENFQYAYSIFGKIIILNQSRLVKEKWAKNPLTKSMFCWCLMQVKYPYLSYYLDQILAPVLLFVDDFMAEHKVPGLKCLAHIIENVGKEELRWYNRHAVIYDALQHQLYTQEAIVLENVLPCLISILGVLEESPRNSESANFNHYDEIFELILYNTEMENKVAFRRIYTSVLPIFIETMGITCLRHIKAFLRITESYLEIYDRPHEIARLNILNSLQKLLEVAWPRVVNHIDFLVKVLLKLLYDVSVEDIMITPVSVKKQLVDKTVEILCNLKKLDENRIEELLSSMNGKIDVADFNLAIESVIMTKC